MTLPFFTPSTRYPVAGPQPCRQRGFTIIELMITITLLAILLALAAPSMGNLVRDQRVKTATFDVYGALAFARSEAIKRNQIVAVCSMTNDGWGCQNSTDWSRGWIVFLDADGNGYPGVVADILKRQDALANITLTGSVGKLGFWGDGRVRRDTPGEPANAAPAFVLSVSGNSAITARCVRLDLGGRPNIKVDTNHNPADGCN